jgi:excinuclease ABC subunit C
VTVDDEQLASLPDEPGVYVFRDAHDGVLYVGKARSLRKRVRQYFAPSTADTRFVVHRIRARAERVETICTGGDQEALLLENTLIKKLKPRYNVRLRDDKDYLCIRVDLRHEWPRLELVRRPDPHAGRTFGPYGSARSARELRRFLNRRFSLRTCKDTSFARRTRPCLQHEMGYCCGPCTLPVDHERYMENVRQAVLYLEGRVDDLIEHLECEMRRLSELMEYERAAEVRDRLTAVRLARETQRVVAVSRVDQDALAVARSGERVVLAVLFFRKGVLTGVREEKVDVTELGDEEILASFVGQYYGADHVLPDEILLAAPLADQEQLAAALSRARGRRTRLHAPRRGRKRQLVDLARENARRLLERWDRVEDPAGARLERLARVLGLEETPRRIECVDISHTAGRQTVGSLAVMVDGREAPPLYRRFRVRAATAGDDYAAMREVLERRFTRAQEGRSGWEMPELMVVDGGRGQLRMAVEVLEELGIEDVALAAIAKDRRRLAAARARGRVRARLAGGSDRDEPEDRPADSVWLPGRKNGIAVKGPASPLALLSRVRDEAHRFAVSYHRKLRSKRMVESELTRIRGVGPVTAGKLLRAFGSVDGVRGASAEQIAERASVPASTARRVAEHLSGGPSGRGGSGRGRSDGG